MAHDATTQMTLVEDHDPIGVGLAPLMQCQPICADTESPITRTRIGPAPRSATASSLRAPVTESSGKPSISVSPKSVTPGSEATTGTSMITCSISLGRWLLAQSRPPRITTRASEPASAPLRMSTFTPVQGNFRRPNGCSMRWNDTIATAKVMTRWTESSPYPEGRVDAEPTTDPVAGHQQVDGPVVQVQPIGDPPDVDERARFEDAMERASTARVGAVRGG